MYRTSLGPSIDDLSDPVDLTHLPLLDRRNLVESFPRLWMTPSLQTAIHKDAVEYTTTSGTSGTRMPIVRKRDWWQDEYVRTYRYNSLLRHYQVGRQPKVILTTAVCSANVCHASSPSYEDRLRGTTLYLNQSDAPSKWTDADIKRMVEELARHRPVYLDADAFYLATFLQRVERLGLVRDLFRPEVLTLSYELTPTCTRAYIASVLQVPIFELFGSTEAGYTFVESDGRIVRCPELSVVEALPYRPAERIFRLVTTSLKNEYMPLIRFFSGDLVRLPAGAELEGTRIPDHGWVERFMGREQDCVRASDGSAVTPGEIDDAVGAANGTMLYYQLTERAAGDMVLSYVAATPAGVAPEVISGVVERLTRLMGPTGRVAVEAVGSLSPMASGKFGTTRRRATPADA
ncbi:hypothetical protein BON30_44075 [Cystobacter ferrugineus]|uniref:CoF synthetase n=2 Tax=Cystobacter ferrugineus TaxID=83449 RepID=A0A1L9AWA6_9BACT|nr:hypothetical protein BON30_44075 [Cystobacter ferrugineus]